MASEASKIRQQCAKKYGLREKAYKEKISQLSSENAELRAKLEDYDNMKRAYVKLSIFSGLSESEKTAVLKSDEMRKLADKYKSILGAENSRTLARLMSKMLTGGSPFDDKEV